MQFEREYHAGSDFCYITFDDVKVSTQSCNEFGKKLRMLGGVHIYDGQYKFPKFITSEVMKELIHNHCFICGGLMQTSELHVDHILRTCQNCGHSHI